MRAFAHPCGNVEDQRLKLSKTSLQTGGVKLVMGNGPMQHCVHPGRQTSHSPLFARGVSQSGVNDLYETLIGWRHKRAHADSIAQRALRRPNIWHYGVSSRGCLRWPPAYPAT